MRPPVSVEPESATSGSPNSRPDAFASGTVASTTASKVTRLIDLPDVDQPDSSCPAVLYPRTSAHLRLPLLHRPRLLRVRRCRRVAKSRLRFRVSRGRGAAGLRPASRVEIPPKNRPGCMKP